MVTRQYRLHVALCLHGIFHQDLPEIKVGLDETVLYHGPITNSRRFEIEQWRSTGPVDLWIDFLNKKDSDVQDGKDKAVVLEEIQLNGISSPKFLWAGAYVPQYPDAWYHEQCASGSVPDNVLHNITYLGWNGRWRLTFAVPVYTWIHNTENLGWIYS